MATTVLVCAIAALTPLQISQVREPFEVFLRSYLKASADEQPPAYAIALADLDGSSNTQEAIVYIQSREWCGSGGCTTLVLQRRGAMIRLVSQIAVTRLPIRILETTTNGWRDLGARVQGGGIVQAYDAVLPFNGRTYPAGAASSPARHANANARSAIVIPTDTPMKPLGPR